MIVLLNILKGESKMSSQETVACPNCGTTATYNVGVSNGSTPCQCKQCKHNFRIHMKNGSVDQVK